MSDNKTAPTVAKRMKKVRRVIARHVECPECGLPMVEREGSTGPFYGCQRFPFCLGTRPKRPYGKHMHDSLTKLLLDARKNAMKYLARADKLGEAGSVMWWLENLTQPEDIEQLERALDAASKKAAELGEDIDFIQHAYDARRAHTNTTLLTRRKALPQVQRMLSRAMPKPVFTKRWDTSELDQIELLLTPVTDEDFDVEIY